MPTTLADLARVLEQTAPLAYQESYDNAGLQCGDPTMEVRGVLIALDCTPAVVEEAIARGCNVVVAHHPLLFKPLKRLTGANEVERTLLKAIKNDVALYAAHTNLDNVRHGVNRTLADKLGLTKLRILDPKVGTLGKLVFYVPAPHTDTVLQALYAVGAGQVGAYANCSFRTDGTGTYTPGTGTTPFRGTPGQPETASEQRVEVLLPLHLQRTALRALRQAHPYEEVAYEVIKLENVHQDVGSGMVGELPEPLSPPEFRARLRAALGVPVVKYTDFAQPITRVAVCGGAGSFLLGQARAAGAQAYVTSDLKYHEYFGAEGHVMLCDVGHYESEQFTSEIFQDLLTSAFNRTFAVLIAQTLTNPVRYDF